MILNTSNSTAALEFVRTFKPGNYKISAVKSKRSKNANAYLWGLCTQIAELLGYTKEDIYRNAVREYGVCSVLSIEQNAVSDFVDLWERNGLAWFVEVANSNDETCTIIAYHGSHVYDTAQMSRLLNAIIEDARSLGIETLSERERSLLLIEWEERKT